MADQSDPRSGCSVDRSTAEVRRRHTRSATPRTARHVSRAQARSPHSVSPLVRRPWLRQRTRPEIARRQQAEGNNAPARCPPGASRAGLARSLHLAAAGFPPAARSRADRRATIPGPRVNGTQSRNLAVFCCAQTVSRSKPSSVTVRPSLKSQRH